MKWSSFPEGDLKRLFKRVYRDDSSQLKGTGGSGIGLSIASAIADLHKGTLTAFATDEFTLCFTVHIPQ